MYFIWSSSSEKWVLVWKRLRVRDIWLGFLIYWVIISHFFPLLFFAANM